MLKQSEAFASFVRVSRRGEKSRRDQNERFDANENKRTLQKQESRKDKAKEYDTIKVAQMKDDAKKREKQKAEERKNRTPMQKFAKYAARDM